MKRKCKWCSKYDLEDNPGDYYHQKDCEANVVRATLMLLEQIPEVMRNAVFFPNDYETVTRRLKQQREMAEFVGD